MFVSTIETEDLRQLREAIQDLINNNWKEGRTLHSISRSSCFEPSMEGSSIHYSAVLIFDIIKPD
jgi:hypothetical protein